MYSAANPVKNKFKVRHGSIPTLWEIRIWELGEGPYTFHVLNLRIRHSAERVEVILQRLQFVVDGLQLTLLSVNHGFLGADGGRHRIG